MTRVILYLLLCILMFPAQAVAAVVGGYINIKADIDQKSVLAVGYARYHPRETQSTVQGKCSYGTDNFGGKPDETSRYQRVLVTWPQGRPCVYRCVNMKPGLHKICVKLGNYVVGKTINVPTADSSIAVDFSMNTKSVGSLQVSLRSAVMHTVMVWPAWNTTQFDWKNMKYCPEAIGVWADSRPGDKQIVMGGLCDGQYKVRLFETDTRPGIYLAERRNKLLKQWIVAIKAGKVTSLKAM